MLNAKDTAHQVIDQLPESATLDDIMYELYVRQKIDQGVQELEDGQGIAHDQVKRRVLGEQNQ